MQHAQSPYDSTLPYIETQIHGTQLQTPNRMNSQKQQRHQQHPAHINPRSRPPNPLISPLLHPTHTTVSSASNYHTTITTGCHLDNNLNCKHIFRKHLSGKLKPQNGDKKQTL